MRRAALDTNRLSDLFGGDQAVALLLGSFDEVLVPLTVIGEIKAGFAGGKHRLRNEAYLDSYLNEKTVRVLYPDLGTADHYANLMTQLRAAGKPIPQNDLWIAALCLQHGLPLITRDHHFQHVPRLMLA